MASTLSVLIEICLLIGVFVMSDHSDRLSCPIASAPGARKDAKERARARGPLRARRAN
jgi:hypothetical protein